MIEIERKFLVVADRWPRGSRKISMRQGYLASQDGLVCRVRQKDDEYFLSLKARIDTMSSYDYEYVIPAADGQTMLDKICTRTAISKTRHEVMQDGMLWEIDEFHALNAGLVVAEVELPGADHPLSLPSWIDIEVTGDARYRNSSLYEKPWTGWSQTSG